MQDKNNIRFSFFRQKYGLFRIIFWLFYTTKQNIFLNRPGGHKDGGLWGGAEGLTARSLRKYPFCCGFQMHLAHKPFLYICCTTHKKHCDIFQTGSRDKLPERRYSMVFVDCYLFKVLNLGFKGTYTFDPSPLTKSQC